MELSGLKWKELNKLVMWKMYLFLRKYLLVVSIL